MADLTFTSTVPRKSALPAGQSALSFGPDLTISERRVSSIWQITAWPGEMAKAGKAAAKAAGAKEAPGPLAAIEGKKATLVRTEPLRWLLISEDELPAPDPGKAGTVLDLTHARTVIRVEGAETPALLARNIPLDLRPEQFPEGSAATSSLDHTAVTLIARAGGVELLVFRSLARSLWHHLETSAAQFAI